MKPDQSIRDLIKAGTVPLISRDEVMAWLSYTEALEARLTRTTPALRQDPDAAIQAVLRRDALVRYNRNQEDA